MKESIILNVLLLCLATRTAVVNNDQVFVVTVASDVKKPGYGRFVKSAETFDIYVENLCDGKCWKNTGTKIIMLRKYLDNLNTNGSKSTIIILVDSYDVLFLSGLDEIIRRFKSFPNTKVLFSGDHYCYPLPSIARRYSKQDRATVYPYLNSGGIIGYLPYIKRIVNYNQYVVKGDDQLYYTLIYLEKGLRKLFMMTLDHSAIVFLPLGGSKDEVKVVNTTKGYLVENVVTNQQAPIIHGQGPTGKSLLKKLYKSHLHTMFENGSLSKQIYLNNTAVKQNNYTLGKMAMHVQI